MPVSKLRFSDVGPFEKAEFEFDQQVNVFVGPNNSGKSTVLWVLGEILVYPFGFPTKLFRSENAVWEAEFLLPNGPRSFSGSLPVSVADLISLFEQIGHTTFVPALRRSTDFRSKGPSVSVGTDSMVKEELARIIQTDPSYSEGEKLESVRRFVENKPESEPELAKRSALLSSAALLVDDEAIIQKLVDLDYRAYRRRDLNISEVIGTISTIVGEITEGFPIEFLGVNEDERGLFPQFRTQDGDVPLNILSQGTHSIISWLTHLLIGYAEYYEFPANLAENPAIMIIDEIDAHLHPSWQRRIIPTLTRHLPNLQIFCSSHSPLMLAGLKAGQVQLLKRDDNGSITVSRNEADIVGWSADEILRNFLDVSSPTDLVTTERLDRLQELRRQENLSYEEVEELEQLRHTVDQDLLAGPMAAQAERFIDLIKQAGTDTTPPEAVAPPRVTRRRTTRRG